MFWQATMELRWHLHVSHQQWDGRQYADVGHQVLEQKWVCLDNGAEEWREVPTHRTVPPNLVSYS